MGFFKKLFLLIQIHIIFFNPLIADDKIELDGIFIGKGKNAEIDLSEMFKDHSTQTDNLENLSTIIERFKTEFLKTAGIKIKVNKKAIDAAEKEQDLEKIHSFLRDERFLYFVESFGNKLGPDHHLFQIFISTVLSPLRQVALNTDEISLDYSIINLRDYLLKPDSKDSQIQIQEKKIHSNYSRLLTFFFKINQCIKSFNKDFGESDFSQTKTEKLYHFNELCKPMSPIILTLKILASWKDYSNLSAGIKNFIMSKAIFDTALMVPYGKIKKIEECNLINGHRPNCEMNYTSVHFSYKDKNGKKQTEWLKTTAKEESYFRLFGYWTTHHGEYVFLAPGESLKFVLSLIQKQILETGGDATSVEIKVGDANVNVLGVQLLGGYPVFFSDSLKNKSLIPTTKQDLLVNNEILKNVPGIWFLNEKSETTFLVRESDFLITKALSHNRNKLDINRSHETKIEGDETYFGTNGLLKYDNIDIKTTWSIKSPRKWLSNGYKTIIVTEYPSVDEYYTAFYSRSLILKQKHIDVMLNFFGIFLYAAML